MEALSNASGLTRPLRFEHFASAAVHDLAILATGTLVMDQLPAFLGPSDSPACLK